MVVCIRSEEYGGLGAGYLELMPCRDRRFHLRLASDPAYHAQAGFAPAAAEPSDLVVPPNDTKH